MAAESSEPKSRARQYLEVVTGPLEDKKRWRQYKARIKALPENYRVAVEAMERYLMHFGPGDGADAASMFEDLADLFERGAADGTPIREIFGEDPVEFVEAFIQSYSRGSYIRRERDRLTSAVERAAGEDTTRDRRV
ncbi:DUF1048 domain-containing protein [Nonomuraea zeae]|uniref:DUF1048 domain-containing protein n=1 Tax=Nonomuraea zeae TaxID=1642303 RepID=A0A5S4GN57_9ACTN|nr:DUF1048 domain-containing protein [Nonomuraea zeae]TMR34229.1 DUF1048 domain-containing protein [Nonomuraea zeae]